jgi:hypothetical protein
MIPTLRSLLCNKRYLFYVIKEGRLETNTCIIEFLLGKKNIDKYKKLGPIFIKNKTVRIETYTSKFWREEKRTKKSARKIKFTNQFDIHKSIWALSVKYQSDAKWLGKHNGIIHFS